MSEITDFYNTQFEETLAQSHSWWDMCHNFIQLLFPTTKPSAHHPDSPVLTIDDALFLNRNKEKIERAIAKFQSFMEQNWQFEQFNHNFLRITRIIQCLNEIKLQSLAASFYDWACECVKANNTRGFKQADINLHWNEALKIQPII